MSAFFGPTEKHVAPGFGFCISAFAIARKRNRVLLLKPRKNRLWLEWAPNWRIYPPERAAGEFVKWRFPSVYVQLGEHPDDALVRIVKEQLGVKKYNAGKGRLLSFYSKSRLFPGQMHWDYCFLYDIALRETPAPKPWSSVVEYVDISNLADDDFGSAQGGLLEALGASPA